MPGKRYIAFSTQCCRILLENSALQIGNYTTLLFTFLTLAKLGLNHQCGRPDPETRKLCRRSSNGQRLDTDPAQSKNTCGTPKQPRDSKLKGG